MPRPSTPGVTSGVVPDARGADDEPAPLADGSVQSLARGLAVIRAFDAEHPAMRLSDVARRTGLSRATARRFLLTLADLGYVRSDERTFTLTPQVLRLGFAYLSSQSLPDLAQPHLQDLSARIGESTSVAVLDGDDITYVARRATSRIMHVSIRVGTRFPAYATSMGRVLLAALDDDARRAYLARVELRPITPATVTDPAALASALEEVARRGYALVDQELEPGLRSLAVPVRGARGEVVAAANVSTNVLSAPERNVLDLLTPLRETAAAIEADLRAQAH